MPKMNERNENEREDKELDLTKARSDADEGIVTDGEEREFAEAAPAPAPAAPAKSSTPIVPWVIAVIAIIALVVVLIRGTSAGTMNEAVGKMDGYTIKKSDLYDSIEKQFGEKQMISLVDSVAQEKIIEMESDKAGIKVSDADVQKELDEVMKQYGMASEADLANALAQSGMTVEDFKNIQVVPNLKIKLLFENKNPASEDDLKKYFEEKKETVFATTPKEIKASHILLNTKEEAEAVLKDLKAGKDFATLAKEKSQDPGSKDEGGDLGFFGTGVMNPRFETAAFALAKGETSEVVEADNGFHIIKVTDVKDAVVKTYDEVKDEVKKTYYNEKMNAEAQAWLESLKTDRKYENLLEKAPEPSPSASETPSSSPEASPSASAAQ